MLYVDTSVIVSALTNEADTVLSQTWLARQEASELTVSDWTATEFASALSMKLRTGGLGAGHRAAAPFRAVDETADGRPRRGSSRRRPFCLHSALRREPSDPSGDAGGLSRSGALR